MGNAERQARNVARLRQQAEAARKAYDEEALPVSEPERRAIAIHEAAHAVVAVKLGFCIKTISIVAGEGRTVFRRNPLRGINIDDCEVTDRAHRQIEKFILATLAGPAAHAIAAPDLWNPEQGGHHFGRGDYDIANDLVSKLNGFPAATESAHRIFLEVAAKDLVERHWGVIEKVAAALLEKETLDETQLCETMRDNAK